MAELKIGEKEEKKWLYDKISGLQCSALQMHIDTGGVGNLHFIGTTD